MRLFGLVLVLSGCAGLALPGGAQTIELMPQQWCLNALIAISGQYINALIAISGQYIAEQERIAIRAMAENRGCFDAPATASARALAGDKDAEVPVFKTLALLTGGNELSGHDGRALIKIVENNHGADTATSSDQAFTSAANPQPFASWAGLMVTTNPVESLQVAPTAHLAMAGIDRANGNGELPGKIDCWGECTFGAPVHFSQSGTYNFTMSACLTKSAFSGNAFEGLSRISIDQIPVDVGSGFVQRVTNYGSACASPSDYTFTAPVLAGNHFVQLWLYPNPNQLTVTGISVALGSVGLPSEPAGSRDGTLQPTSSWSIWNTAIGSRAQWSNAADADTETVDSAHGVVNSSLWSVPVYVGQSTDPIQTFRTDDTIFVAAGDALVHMPVGMTVAPPVSGGDHTIALYDATDPRWQYSGFGCTVTASPGEPGLECGRTQIFDMCNGFNNATGQGSGEIPGLIRSWEVTSGSIKHMLLIGLATNLVAPVPTPWTGLAWPAWESDYKGAFGGYTGNVQYGSTVAIPSIVDINSLGLTPSGLVLAHALQDYGGMIDVTGGQPNPNITLFAEQDVSQDASQLADMSNDWANKLVPLLRILRNQGPSSINGGGMRLQPTQPGLAVCQ